MIVSGSVIWAVVSMVFGGRRPARRALFSRARAVRRPAGRRTPDGGSGPTAPGRHQAADFTQPEPVVHPRRSCRRPDAAGTSPGDRVDVNRPRSAAGRRLRRRLRRRRADDDDPARGRSCSQRRSRRAAAVRCRRLRREPDSQTMQERPGPTRAAMSKPRPIRLPRYLFAHDRGAHLSADAASPRGPPHDPAIYDRAAKDHEAFGRLRPRDSNGSGPSKVLEWESPTRGGSETGRCRLGKLPRSARAARRRGATRPRSSGRRHGTGAPSPNSIVPRREPSRTCCRPRVKRAIASRSIAALRRWSSPARLARLGAGHSVCSTASDRVAADRITIRSGRCCQRRRRLPPGQRIPISRCRRALRTRLRSPTFVVPASDARFPSTSRGRDHW